MSRFGSVSRSGYELICSDIYGISIPFDLNTIWLSDIGRIWFECCVLRNTTFRNNYCQLLLYVQMHVSYASVPRPCCLCCPHARFYVVQALYMKLWFTKFVAWYVSRMLSSIRFMYECYLAIVGPDFCVEFLNFHYNWTGIQFLSNASFRLITWFYKIIFLTVDFNKG